MVIKRYNDYSQLILKINKILILGLHRKKYPFLDCFYCFILYEHTGTITRTVLIYIHEYKFLKKHKDIFHEENNAQIERKYVQ
jgi:hypothetical protein